MGTAEGDFREMRSLVEIIQKTDISETIMITGPLTTQHKDSEDKITFRAVLTHYNGMEDSRVIQCGDNTINNVLKDDGYSLIIRIIKNEEGQYSFITDKNPMIYPIILIPETEATIGFKDISKRINSLIKDTEDNNLRNIYKDVIEYISNYVSIIKNTFSEGKSGYYTPGDLKVLKIESNNEQ